MHPTSLAREIIVFSAFILFIPFLVGCESRNEKKEAATDSVAQVSGTASRVQPAHGTPASDQKSIHDSTIQMKYRPLSLKAAFVIVDYADHTVYMGEKTYSTNKYMTVQKGNPARPVKVVIFRKLVLTPEQKKNGTNLHVGGAYVMRAPHVYDYIGDVDLSLSDGELAALFGVIGK